MAATSANDPRVLVGLGDTAAIINKVRVEWPDGAPKNGLMFPLIDTPR